MKRRYWLFIAFRQICMYLMLLFKVILFNILVESNKNWSHKCQDLTWVGSNFGTKKTKQNTKMW